MLNKKEEMKAVNEWSYLSPDLQDSDGEAGIALVGVHGEYPKYANDDKLFSDKEGAATVGWVYTHANIAYPHWYKPAEIVDRGASVCPQNYF